MEYWTKILTLLNIIDKGSIAKPYNSFVVRNFFTPLAQHLNLISEDNREYNLTTPSQTKQQTYYKPKSS